MTDNTRGISGQEKEQIGNNQFVQFLYGEFFQAAVFFEENPGQEIIKWHTEKAQCRLRGGFKIMNMNQNDQRNTKPFRQINIFYPLCSSHFSVFSICLRLNRVEPFAIHAAGGGLGDEGFRVDALDEAEDGDGLGLADDDEQHLQGFLRIAAVAVEDGAAAVQVVDDVLGNLLVFLREDEELDGLAVAVHDLVDHVITYDHLDEGEDDFRHVVEEEIGRTDDEEIEHQHGAAYRDVLILRDNHADDVGPARAAVRRENQPQARTAKRATDDDGHEGFALDNRPVEYILKKREGEREGENAEDGLHEELPPQNLERDGEEEDVDDEVGNGNRDELIRREENQGAETAQPARHDLVREDEAVEAETVKQRAEEDDGIIPHFVFA